MTFNPSGHERDKQISWCEPVHLQAIVQSVSTDPIMFTPLNGAKINAMSSHGSACPTSPLFTS